MVFVIGPALLVGKESEVFNFFSKVIKGDYVLVVSVVEVVVLHELLVLQVSVFLLDSVELISEGEVVLVSLLDFEDLCLQLRNQKVLLVIGEVD